MEDEAAAALQVDNLDRVTFHGFIKANVAALSLDLFPDENREHIVDTDSLRVETLRLKHVSKLFKKHELSQAERKGLLKSEAGLVEALLAIVETQDSIKRPNLRIEVVKDVGLSNGILSSS